jgi:hypothetical protein
VTTPPSQTSSNIDLDLNLIRDFVTQTRPALPLLPEKTRAEMQPLLQDIELEAATAEPDETKLRGLLRSARAVCEGAAGNLAAQGILQLLHNIMGT